jgi:hypothetical protein
LDRFQNEFEKAVVAELQQPLYEFFQLRDYLEVTPVWLEPAPAIPRFSKPKFRNLKPQIPQISQIRGEGKTVSAIYNLFRMNPCVR